MASTEAHGTVPENADNTTPTEALHISTTNGQGGNPPPLSEAQTQALGSQESDVPNTEHNRPSSKPYDRLLPVSESLGRSGLLSIIGGSLWILGIFGFLTFLWFGYGSRPEAADATGLWRFIALRNYFPQAITLCALALRVAVSFQAAVCTSMIAAIVLEKHGAQRTRVAWLSVMRSINDGLFKLCGLLVKSNGMVVSLRHIEIWFTFLMLIVTSVLQFSSTLLLSDIHDFTIVGDINSTQFGDLILFKKENFYEGGLGLYFVTQPPVYAVFGEVQASFSATPNANGVSDTGIIQRSLLPISESDARSSVRKVEATTAVITSQSGCIRPQINATYSADRDHGFEGEVYGYINGTVDYEQSFGRAGIRQSSLCSDTGCGDTPFSCNLPITQGHSWQAVTCFFDGIVDLIPLWDPEDGVWSRNTTVVLVITTNMDSKGWSGIPNETTLPPGNPHDEWQSYEIGTGQFINITLCSSGFSLHRFDTLMSTLGPLLEPKTDFELASTIYNTEDVQNFMGVSNPQQNHYDRHILDLKIIGTPDGDNTHYISETKLNSTIETVTMTLISSAMYFELSNGLERNNTMLLCYLCGGYGYAVNSEIGLLFTDIITETGRAANALLSLTTTLFTSVYYAYLGSFKVARDARIVSTTTVPAPGPCFTNGCPGYVSVTTLLFVHLLCVAAITIVYVRQTRYSRHGNIWHAISQLAGAGLTDMLQEAQDANDAKVESVVDKGNKNYRVKLGRQRARGPVEVINI
ncbi:hypothetical protein GGR51DRAFT_510337 [Nemania sp. FL0031]|nr:hypothetical protein GGR51DRAFT_510337 [Nemania sp. FL0031]